MNKALLIIDVQEGLFSPSPAPYQHQIVVNHINQLIAKARQHQIPVIFIQHQDNQYLIPDSDNWQLYHQLHSTSNDFYIDKTTPDSFLNTNLLILLQKLNIERLVICGYASEYCVDTTTRRAASLGFPVILAQDAHTTHDKPHAKAEQIIIHHTQTLTDLTSFGVEIMALPSSEIQF